LLLVQEKVGEGGGGIVILRIYGQQAAIGQFGGRLVAGGFSQFAGEEDVFGGFGGDFDSGEELVARRSGVGVLVDAGESTIGAALEGGIVCCESSCCEEYVVGVGETSAASEQETQGQVRVEVGGVGGDSAAVGSFGGGGLVECVLGEGEVVEEMRVVRRFFG